MGHHAVMGIAVSLIITAVGFILALAVHPAHPGAVDVNTVGWILVIVGIVGFVVDLLLWSSAGPGYLRRTYVDQGAAPARRRYGPRRTVVEEEEVAGPPPPGY
jgi:preprotein translocase subunit Sss1